MHRRQHAGQRPRPARRTDDGAAAVEFGLVLVPLLALVFGAISYGYMLSFRQAMSQGAAEGARAAAVWASAYDSTQDPARIAAARVSIDEALSSYGVGCGSGATCTITITPCVGGSGRCVSVAVSYPYAADPLTPDPVFVPLPDELRYEAEARVS